MLNTRDRISTICGGSRPVLRTGLKTRSPRVRLVAPRVNFSVHGDVFVLIDAKSDHEPIGGLNVEVQIDDNMLIAAKYSTHSGYYGAIWDSSEESAGTMHRLFVKVTDSDGNSRSTFTTVAIG